MKLKLRDWFNKKHNRPLKIAAGFLFAVWVVFVCWSFVVTHEKQELAATQTADLLSLAISSKDRPMAESILEGLVAQSGAVTAAVCEGSKMALSANQDFSGCEDKSPRFRTVIEKEISGSGRIRLKVAFDWSQNFASLLSLLAFGLVLVVAGFYFIQTAQKQIEKGILQPLKSKLLTDEPLEIQELDELQKEIRKSQMAEAQKAVAVAIEEHNQQVAHDIRSPIAALNELLKLVPIADSKLRSAIDKAMDRTNSITNDLLSKEAVEPKVDGVTSYDLATIVQNIATEKGPLFAGGRIETFLADRLVIETKLPQSALARILSNVIDNAMAACVDRKYICITAVRNHAHVEISVRDTGIGIGEEALKRVGEKGFSLAKPSGAKGTGRGIFHAKRILGEVGGGVEFSSSLGEGTTVVLRLPALTVSFDLSPMDFILVDNDDLVHIVWETKAAARGLTLKGFSSVAALLSFSEVIPRHIPIFLDSDLGSKIKGQTFAPELRKLGFQRIYVTTNYKELHGTYLLDVDAVIPKKCERAMELLEITDRRQGIEHPISV